MEPSVTHHHGHTELTPEKLALMKLTSSELNGDILSAPTSPSPYRKSSGFSLFAPEMSSRTEIARSSSRRQSSLAGGNSYSSYRKFSSELSSQAESRFHALMELMASASKEATSLKSVWEKIMFEREMFAQEREELVTQITEVTTEMNRRDTDRSRHTTEATERKKQIEKLLFDLSTALTGLQTEKKKVADRDGELIEARTEARQLRETATRSSNNYERAREELEKIEFRLKSVEEERDVAREESDRHHRDLHKNIRERNELSSRLTDISQKFELSRKEVLSFTDRLKVAEVEREEGLQEIDRLKDETKKAKTRANDASKGYIEATEKFERIFREHNKLKEVVRIVESERDEHLQLVESLRREIKNSTVGQDEANDRLIEVSKKYEAMKRELIGIKDSLRTVELERNESIDLVEKTRESVRIITSERDEVNDNLNSVTKKSDDYRRQITLLTESLRKTEETLSEVRTEVINVSNTVKVANTERDEAKHNHGRAVTEIGDLRERILMFEHEVRSLTEARNNAHTELDRVRREFSEVTETITSYRDDSGELEFEINSLRTMLRDVREQKERAITARSAADKERDEYVSKYEEKCRELERFEESMHQHYHNSRSSGSDLKSSRTITRSATNNASSSHHLSSSHEGANSSSSAAVGGASMTASN